MPTLRPARAGFTLLEMTITLLILSIVTAMAIPSFSGLLAQSRVAAAAKAYAAALRKAQAEAIARNRNVEVLFTAADPTPLSAASAVATTGASGTGWMVRRVGASIAADFIDGFRLVDQTPGVVIDATPTILGFTPLGRPVDLSGGTLAALPATTVVRFTESVSSRRYCTYLTTGGAARVCDPTLASGNPLSCLPQLAAGDC